MYNFASSTWTEADTQRKRERVARMSDEKLQDTLEAAEYMCSPRAYWGERPRESYIIQREIVPGGTPAPGGSGDAPVETRTVLSGHHTHRVQSLTVSGRVGS